MFLAGILCLEINAKALRKAAIPEEEKRDHRQNLEGTSRRQATNIRAMTISIC